MQKKLLAVTIAGIAALFVACNIFGSKEDYYPLSIGSTWNYFFCTIMSTGNDGSMDTIETTTSSTRATMNDKLNSGEDVVALVKTGTVHLRFPRETTYAIIETCYTRKTENFVLDYESKNDTEPDTVLALPLAVGKKWHINSELTAEVLQRENVTVTAGIYPNAWKIEMVYVSGQDTFRIFTWYASGVGNIKYSSEQSSAGDTFIYHGELVSANVK
ncbi:MAG: hypothetical protein ACUVUD_06055 [bacterium]